ncbi:MAG: hypothetical protein R3C58_08750 [Parvularculaceae bacterium]
MFASFVAAALAAAFIAAEPAESEKAIDDAISCRDIADDMARLACLDKAADVLATTRILRVQEEAEREKEEKDAFGFAGGKGVDPLTAPVADTPETFGSESLPDVRRSKDEKRLKRVTGAITEIRMNQFNRATIVLENGQVWKQLSSDSAVLHFGAKERQFTASIKRGAMGNYMLTVEELKKTIRVRRVK